MAIPNFMVVGAQKSGTTWLFECLDEHPRCSFPASRKCNFFDLPEQSRFSQLHRGLDWYLGLFPDDPDYLARGEVTPDYMFYPQVVDELFELNRRCGSSLFCAIRSSGPTRPIGCSAATTPVWPTSTSWSTHHRAISRAGSTIAR